MLRWFSRKMHAPETGDERLGVFTGKSGSREQSPINKHQSKQHQNRQRWRPCPLITHGIVISSDANSSMRANTAHDDVIFVHQHQHYVAQSSCLLAYGADQWWCYWWWCHSIASWFLTYKPTAALCTAPVNVIRHDRGVKRNDTATTRHVIVKIATRLPRAIVSSFTGSSSSRLLQSYIVTKSHDIPLYSWGRKLWLL